MSGIWKETIQERAKTHGVDPERAWVWEQLSTLFLDTEITSEDLRSIAGSLASSRFSIPELIHIYDKEVNPVCIWNVFAWQWAGFDPDWLIQKCAKEQRSHPFKEGRKQPNSLPFSFAFCFSDACAVFEQLKQLRRDGSA